MNFREGFFLNWKWVVVTVALFILILKSELEFNFVNSAKSWCALRLKCINHFYMWNAIFQKFRTIYFKTEV